MWERGFWQLGSVRGVPVRVHWTMPLGAMAFGGFGIRPVFWLGFFVLVLLHELGHAALVWRAGHRVISLDITGIGGLCRWAGRASSTQRAVIAWGGVAAQALLAALVGGVVIALGAPSNSLLADLVQVFLWTNLWLIALNLLPFAPFDGAEAWTLFRGLGERLRAGWRRGADAASAVKERAAAAAGPPKARRAEVENPFRRPSAPREAVSARSARPSSRPARRVEVENPVRPSPRPVASSVPAPSVRNQDAEPQAASGPQPASHAAAGGGLADVFAQIAQDAARARRGD